MQNSSTIQSAKSVFAHGKFILAAALLFLFTFLIYMPALDGEPIWDDEGHITKPHLRSTEGLGQIWTNPRSTQQYYPLTHSAFWIQHQLWGDHTRGYHVVNVFLHIANTMLVWVILRRLRVPGALLAAGIFALHPAHVASVAWISELKNTLSTLLYLTAMLAYLQFDLSIADETKPDDPLGARHRRWPFYGLALLSFIGALLSKTVTASFPAAILLIVWWKHGRVRWSRNVLPLVPFFALAAGMGLMTAVLEREYWGAHGEDFGFSWIDRMLIAGRASWFYLAKLTWPGDLMPFYPRWTIDAADWRQYLYPLAALGLIAVLWTFRQRIGRAPLAALLFYGGTLLPALGFVNLYWQVYSFVFDHVQYLASLGIIALAAAAISMYLRTIDLWGRPTGLALGAILLGGLALASWRQAHLYKNKELFYAGAIARNPSCFVAYYNLANRFLDRHEYDSAITLYQRAVELKRRYPEAYSNLGLAYMHRGLMTEAVQAFTQAIAIKPNLAEAYSNMGLALTHLGRLDEAFAAHFRALKLNPQLANAYYHLGVTHEKSGNTAQALEAYRSCLKLKPDLIHVLNNLAWIHATSPDPAFQDGSQAVRLAVRAVQLSPEPEPMLLGTLAAAYARAGRFEEACQAARQAIELAIEVGQPELAEATRLRLAIYQARTPYTRKPTPES